VASGEQQLVSNIVNFEIPASTISEPVSLKANGKLTLPDWCNVYDGLSTDKIAAMEQTILQRAEMSRPSE
jgi:hypothetical protein